MRDIQATMSLRALELLNLPEDQHALLLDLGCGSGLSGQIITEAGHDWIGLDISTHMLGTITIYTDHIDHTLTNSIFFLLFKVLHKNKKLKEILFSVILVMEFHFVQVCLMVQ